MATEPSSNPEDNEIFQQLESYNWEKDTEFQGGLSAILGPATDASQIQELTLRAQVFYLSRKRKIPIDFDAYKAYLSTRSSSSSAVLTSTTTSTTTSHPTMPPHHTPTTSPPSTTQPANQTSKPSEAPYPQTFAEIVQLITAGAPIPGIKDIPPTLLTGQATKAQASKRRKPWEADVPDDVIAGKAEGTFGDRRDEVIVQELPE